MTPQPGVARIPALLSRVCAAGVPVELSVEAPGGMPRDLPPGVDLAAFRVVQEALTNVIKHAGRPGPRSASSTARGTCSSRCPTTARRRAGDRGTPKG